MKKLFIPPVFVLISLILIVGFYFFMPGFNIIPFPFNFLGILVAFPGFALTGKTWELFRHHQTSLYIEKSSALITEGIFAKTRNPMYCGMFMVLLGVSVCFMNVFSMLIPFLFIAIIRIAFIPVEEKMMCDVFGQAYLDYKQKVRRWV
jgi:protein-S-isoprenylcysteine O-methyltransferase Ste14